jgi:hypothetical protein
MNSDEELRRVFREVQLLPEAKGRRVCVTLGGNWFADIIHEKGYTVWYMPGETPLEALTALRDALNNRRGQDER